MPAIDKPGTYVLTAQDANWTESKNGTPCFSIHGVDEDGQYITAFLYFSDAAFKNSYDAIVKTFGLGLPMEEWPDKVKGQQYRAVVENDPYEGKDRMKVKWVNPLSFVPPKPKDEGSLFRKLNALARANGAKATAAAPKAPTPAPKPSVVDDDVPF